MSTKPVKPVLCPNPIMGLLFGAACNPHVEGAALGVVAPAAPTINQTVNSVPGDILNTMLQPLLAALPGIGVKVGVFLFALILLIIGFMIVSRQP